MKLIITDIKDFDLTVDGEHKIIKPEGPIKNCIGCFGCWVKTPGQCVIKDGYHTVGYDMSRCDEQIIISKCLYGGFGSFVKMVLDRGISYVRPDFAILKSGMRHKQRYFNKIKITAYFYGEDITEEEKKTATGVVYANAKNFYAEVKKVCFLENSDILKEVVL